MSKKIIIFDANPLIGKITGVGYLTQYLIDELSKSSEIELVGHYFNFFNKKDTSRLSEFTNIKFIETTFFPTKLINILRRLRIELPLELFTRKKADTLIFTNFTSMPSIFRTRSILFIHDLGYIDHPEYVSDANSRFLQRYVPRSIRRSSDIVTISNFTKERIKDVYKTKVDVTVIPVPPVRKNTSTEKDSLVDFKIDGEFILFIGTIEPRKNIVTLLNAMREIHKQTDVSLVLAGGKGWKDNKILEEISHLKKSGVPVIQTGYITDKQKVALYQKTSLYIQPSFYEGFGMPILEAMSYGAPVLCSDIPVLKEVAGNSASFFEVNDSDDLAKKAVEILNNTKKAGALRGESLKKFQEYPRWPDVAEEIKKII